MNVERLHALLRTIQSELESTNAPAQLNQLSDALANLANSPQQPEFQQQVSTLKERLVSSLRAASSNSFSPAWTQLVRELGIADLLGDALADRIEEILERNQITTTTAHQEISAIATRLTELNSWTANAVGSFVWLGLGAEELEEGQFEVGVLIPRRAVRNELRSLGEEFEEISRLLGPFVELCLGARPALEVRSISSSEFGVYLEAVPKVAACIAVAVERLTAFYRQLLEIRKLRDGLAAQDVPPEALAPLDTHANGVMSEAVGQIVEEVVTEFSTVSDLNRLNELRVELTFSLNGFANRIDNGFNVEVRGPTEPDADDDTEDMAPEGTTSEVDGYARMIRDRREALQFINDTGTPMLSLPEGPGTQSTDDGDDAAS